MLKALSAIKILEDALDIEIDKNLLTSGQPLILITKEELAKFNKIKIRHEAMMNTSEGQTRVLHFVDCEEPGCEAFLITDNYEVDDLYGCNKMISCNYQTRCDGDHYFCDKHSSRKFKTVKHEDGENLVCDKCCK